MTPKELRNERLAERMIKFKDEFGISPSDLS